jgi:thermitase
LNEPRDALLRILSRSKEIDVPTHFKVRLLLTAICLFTTLTGQAEVSRRAATPPGVSRITSIYTTGAVVNQTTATGASAYVEDEVLVKYKAQTQSTVRMSVAARFGMTEQRHVAALRLSQLKLPAGQTVPAAMEALALDPAVEYVQPNYIYHTLATPTDPAYGLQWGFKNTGQTVDGGYTPNSGPAGNDMNLEPAWDYITDCSPVVVAVVDTGVNYQHQDLAANMWDGGVVYPHHGYDFVDNDNDPFASDAEGHATHVAATIGAAANNNVAGVGVCWKARIMSVRVLGPGGSGTTANIVLGINFAAANGARVINMSLGGSSFDQAFSDAITTAGTAGVLMVVAAGNATQNNDTSSAYPCNFSQANLICVAALDQSYNLASFSNYGASTVDIAAPGTNVLSAWPGQHFSDDFSTWTRAGDWSLVNCAPVFFYDVTPMLVNPASWCSNGTYANNINDVAYRTFDFSNAAAFHFAFNAIVNLEPNADFLGIAINPNGGDPFASGGILLTENSSSNSLLLANIIDSVHLCTTANCSIGVRLRSNASNVFRGAGLFNVTVETTVNNATDTLIINGTSMATPHVAGLAAMLMAYNPDFTVADSIAAILNGGRSVPSLAGKTVSGRAADALGSLSYIQPPTGIAAQVQ